MEQQQSRLTVNYGLQNAVKAQSIMGHGVSPVLKHLLKASPVLSTSIRFHSLENWLGLLQVMVFCETVAFFQAVSSLQRLPLIEH